MSEKVWFLKRCDLFERLSPEELRSLESRCRTRSFPRNNPIYLPADEANGVLLLASGLARICSFTTEGKQAILAFVEPGELFGELALLDDGPRDEYAETVDPSTVILIPADAMQELMERHSEVALGVTKLFGLRRRRVERRLRSLLFRSNRERLVHLLLELAEDYGRKTSDGLLIELKLSHQDLANVIGSTRETVTVILGELQAERYLTVGRRKLVLTDMARLAASIEAEPPRPRSAAVRARDRSPP